MFEENEKQVQKQRGEIVPALKQFIDDAIVPILVREYLKEDRSQQRRIPRCDEATRPISQDTRQRRRS